MNIKKVTRILAIATFATAANSVIALPTNITVDDSGDYLQNGAAPGDPALSLASVAFYQIAAGLSSGSSNDRETNFAFLATVVGDWNAYGGALPPAILGTTPAADNGSIGGLGSFWGVIIAALLVGVLRGVTVHFIPAASEASMYVLMLLVLLLRPRGLLGEAIQKFER